MADPVPGLPPLRVAVGSLSPIKLDAVRCVFRAVFPDRAVEVRGVDTQSGVNAQPMGHDETLRGCANRLRQAVASSPEAHFAVAMENGLVPVNVPSWSDLSASPPTPSQQYFDVAWVAVYDIARGQGEWSHSAGLPFPVDAVEEAQAQGLETTTAGWVLQRRGRVPNHADPHRTLTAGLAPRGALLEAALRVALGLHRQDRPVGAGAG
eukprot:EG_transcript_23076